MRRLLPHLIFLLLDLACLFGIATSAHAQTVKVLGKRATGAAPSCSSVGVTHWWRLEGATLDGSLDFAVGDAVATLSGMTTGTPVAQPSGLGTAILYSTSNANPSAVFDIVAEDKLTWVEGKFDFHFRYKAGAWNTTNAGVSLIRWDDTTGISCTTSCGDRIDIRTTVTPGVIRLEKFRSGGSAISSGDSTIAMAADTWYHIEGYWKDTTGNNNDQIYLCIDGPTNCVGTSIAQAQDVVRTGGAEPPNRLWIGDHNTGTGNDWLDVIYFDQVLTSLDSTKNLYECRTTPSYP